MASTDLIPTRMVPTYRFSGENNENQTDPPTILVWSVILAIVVAAVMIAIKFGRR